MVLTNHSKSVREMDAYPVCWQNSLFPAKHSLFLEIFSLLIPRRELGNKWLRRSGFLPRNRARKAQNCKLPC
jgi:hypothetical protein